MGLNTYLRVSVPLVMVCLILGKVIYAQECDMAVPCECCFEDYNCVNRPDKWCAGPCKNGYWGVRCINKCPDVCVSCDQNYGRTNECHQCVDGRHGLNCSKSCPLGCMACGKNTGICPDCKPGFYGPTCTNICPVNCKDNHCVKDSGDCVTCEDGYHGNKCLCSNNCERCENLTGDCSVCKPGYFGEFCRSNCSASCKDMLCNSTSGFCFECKPGLYGNNCNETCSDTCAISFCERLTGHCDQCISGFYGVKCQHECESNCTEGICNKTTGICNGCVNGYHGDFCNETCPNNCFNSSCHRHSGVCISCINGFFGNHCCDNCSTYCNNSTCNKASGVCNECVDGYYTPYCNVSCPNHCEANVCKRYSGECIQCVPGFFERFCNNSCPMHCKNQTCERDTGVCMACSGDFYGPICDECVSGYYGDFCNETCPETCFNSSCDRWFGDCLSCVYGYFGNQCDQNCSQFCSNGYCNKTSGFCNSCIDGHYGSYCNRSCSDNCVDNLCDREAGYCETCYPSLYGDFCEQNCSDTCQNTTCNMTSGACSACAHGFHGPFCNMDCSMYCYNDVCDMDTAVCMECIAGRHGKFCSKECSQNCNNTICNQTSGFCSHGCMPHFKGDTCEECITGMYGPHCNLSCSTFCNNSTCDRENGTCLDGCISNEYSDSQYCCLNNSNCAECSSPTQCTECKKGLYGENCEVNCSQNCIGACNKVSGYCVACTINTYGQICELNCSDTCILPENETSVCLRSIGTCIHGCTEGYFGAWCRNFCSDFCYGPCNQESGHCSACMNNTYGPFCNMSCPRQCITNGNATCLQSNYSCTEGCKPDSDGDMCGWNCSTTCNNSCDRWSGKCNDGCIENYTGEFCKTEEISQSDGPFDGESDQSMMAVAVTISIVTVCTAGVVTGVVIFIRRRRFISNRKHIYLNSRNNGNSKPHVSHVYENTVFSGQNASTEPDESTMDMSIKQEIIGLQSSSEGDKSNICRGRSGGDSLWETLSKTDEVLQEEFLALPNGLIKSYGDSRRPENISKNRYTMIYPYDETRVKLLDGQSDYINASYIHGCKKDHAYIAALGPTTKTLGNEFQMFWEMVWQEKVETIVMLTKLVEITGMKCDQYWPNQGATTQHGQVTVTSVSEEEYAEFVVRNWTISKKSERRQLHHVHFTAWPDKGVPSDVISINNLRHKVVKLRKMFDGPLLIHCSAGIGRTGTYIALDILTEAGASGEYIDVFECVNTMRQQRVNMVQTLDQYKYLHHAVLWSLTSDIEPLPAGSFMDLSWLYEDQHLAQLHKQLQTESFYDTDEMQEAIAENKAVPFANRHGADIPGARNTVFLFTCDDNGFDRATYINAVYIDGYRKQNRFIAAQTPLPETVANFLNMIIQENVTCIVDLTPDENQEDVSACLPVDDQDIQHNTFVFRVTRREDTITYTKQEVGIYEQDNLIQTIHHFKFNKWDSGELLPNSPEEFLQLVNDVEKLVITNDMSGPIIVHCLTGAVNSGLFCAVWVLTERIGTDFGASVLNTLGQIKTRRRMAFQNEEQIAFCFECVAAHLKNLDQHVYSNMVLNN